VAETCRSLIQTVDCSEPSRIHYSIEDDVYITDIMTSSGLSTLNNIALPQIRTKYNFPKTDK